MRATIFLAVLGFFFATSCSNPAEKSSTNNPDKYLPPSSGTHTEMLIVASDEVWESAVAEALAEVFGQEQYGLPQPEGVFSINRIKTHGFQGMLERAKSIVFVELDDSTMIDSRKNVWARPQVVTTISAPTAKELSALIKANNIELVSLYHKADLGVVRGRMRKNIYKTLPEGLRNMGIKSMFLQEGFENTLNKENLQIFRQETKNTTQFFLVYSRPMRDNILPGTDIISVRDSIGRNYFQGSAENSYFATETLFPPKQSTTQVDGQFAIETRGLWMAVNDFMGGPFLSYSIYNDQANEVLTIEGFIYGPDAKKRDVLLEMEGMMTSVKLEK